MSPRNSRPLLGANSRARVAPIPPPISKKVSFSAADDPPFSAISSSNSKDYVYSGVYRRFHKVSIYHFDLSLTRHPPEPAQNDRRPPTVGEETYPKPKPRSSVDECH